MRKLAHVATLSEEDIRKGGWLRNARADAPHRLVEDYAPGELRAVYAAVATACPPDPEADAGGDAACCGVENLISAVAASRNIHVATAASPRFVRGISTRRRPCRLISAAFDALVPTP